MRRGRTCLALAVALILGAAGVCAAGAAARTPDRPDARCIHEGLAPIPVTLRASPDRHEGIGRPTFDIRWSGKPLPAGCGARRSVAIYFTIWFPHLRFVFTEGFPIHWLEFWNGRKTVRGGEESYVSDASFEGLGCVIKARAKLRYQVTVPGGAVVARRIVSAPVEIPPCSQ